MYKGRLCFEQYIHNHLSMKVVKTLLVISLLGLMTSGWGDVLHYPEFVKHMGEIGNYGDSIEQGQEDNRFKVPNNKKAFVDLVREAVDKLMSLRRMKEKDSMVKSFYSLSQLRGQ